MSTISTIKEQELLETPLLLFECTLVNGEIHRWSTHSVTLGADQYEPRILHHRSLEAKTLSDEGIDAVARISATLANTDSYCSQIERNTGWKGAKVVVRFAFFDLRTGAAVSEDSVVFRGAANAPEEIAESTCRLSFANRLGLQRLLLPAVRIQRRCPWMFPATEAQRIEAMYGGERGKYSPFFPCGYSAGQPGGEGNLDSGVPFANCEYTREQCEQRGMFREDAGGSATRRFGGVEFAPASILVRSYGEQGFHASAPVENQARYNDFVPLVYGRAWYEPPIVFARNDGNLTRMEVLLGTGEIEGVAKVIVNGIEIPGGEAGREMTATGWFNVASIGNRTGDFNYDFTDGSGQPLGDPYGGMAYLSVVVPNHVSDGRALPRVQVLIDGLRLEVFREDGTYQETRFTNNPAWVLLDLLRRCGWSPAEIDLGSFARTAIYCDELIPAQDLHGNPVSIARFQCNLVVRRRRSAADLVRGVRTGSGLFLTYGSGGKLQLRAESTVATQQPVKPGGSNSTELLNGGWPAYEFGDGSLGFSGILRRANGEPALRVWARPTADTPNRYTVEFQDAFNEFQQDSLSLVDIEDALRTGQEVTARLSALGIPNFSQAARIIRRHLDKGIRGNLFLEFETSVRSIGLSPGDLITVTYLKEGWQRQPFRVIKAAAGLNHATSVITCQFHNDAWYSDDAGEGAGRGRRQQGSEVGLPRPLLGKLIDPEGRSQFEVVEQADTQADGGASVTLAAGYTVPRKPVASGLGIPLLSLAADVDTTGGSLEGGRSHYYAISAVGGGGAESGLSFVVRAAIPAGTATNTVTLSGISLSSGATGFHVYRGPNPLQLRRIASAAAPSAEFTDDGLADLLIGPPDENFDHARFYWRMEKAPEHQATVYSANTIGSDVLQMVENEHAGMVVRITTGTGAGQERVVLGNNAHTLTLTATWDVEPDSSSFFTVAESAWHFGGWGATSPVEFEVPNREGATVQISGRSVNAHGRECAYELSPLTRWTIGGAMREGDDADVPAPPIFGLIAGGQGTIELTGVGFQEFENTGSIQAGTLSVHYWDELASPPATFLAAGTGAEDATVEINVAGGGQIGTLIQIDAEVLVLEKVLDGGLRYEVTRGSHGTEPAAHAAGSPVYHLTRKVFVIPFVKNFFGSPASGSYSSSIFLPDARIAAAEFFMTNSRGNSESTRNALTWSVDRGLRTLSGGQLTIQVEGPLAIEANAAPPLVVESAHSVRDIFAVIKEAPAGAPVELQLQRDGAPYCNLTIPAGETLSNTVDGFGLPPLGEKSELTVHILFVGQTADSSPGRDLSVIIRL